MPDCHGLTPSCCFSSLNPKVLRPSRRGESDKSPQAKLCLASDQICTESSQHDHYCWASQSNKLKVICGQPDVSMTFLEAHTHPCLLSSCGMRSRQQGTFPNAADMISSTANQKGRHERAVKNKSASILKQFGSAALATLSPGVHSAMCSSMCKC